MQTLNDYMKLPYRMEIVEDQEEGGYVLSFPELPGCITCGETLESALKNADDAKKAWLQDEDDYVRIMSDRYYQCPYYRNGDEYAVVRKQM